MGSNHPKGKVPAFAHHAFEPKIPGPLGKTSIVNSKKMIWILPEPCESFFSKNSFLDPEGLGGSHAAAKRDLALQKHGSKGPRNMLRRGRFQAKQSKTGKIAQNKPHSPV